MTREEVIKYLRNTIPTYVSLDKEPKMEEALDMAIEALKELDLLEQSHKMFQKLFEVANEKKGAEE